MLRPEVFEIKYGTRLHDTVLEAVRRRFRLSYDSMSRRYDAWKIQEERAKAYINLSTNDRVRKELRKTGKPQYVTLDIPYSYAMLLTAHTYWTSVLTGRSPIFQYQGNNGQAQTSEQGLEALINYQVSASDMALVLSLWLMDTGKYGLGVIGNGWVEESVYTSQTIEVPAAYYGIPLPFAKPRYKRQTMKIPAYQGNRAFNIRPQDFFPDPRKPISLLQKGEFCGHKVKVGWNTVLCRQQDGFYFNIDEMQNNLRAARGETHDTGSSQMVLPAEMDTLYYQTSTDGTKDDKKSYLEIGVMYVELVPKDWGLGSSPYPEKWVFEIGNDAVILCAMPSGAYHGQFEYYALEYEIEGYELTKRGMLEVVDPLNEVLTWLFNSHMYNVRKMMNDQLVVDPSRIVMKDLTDPAAGRIIRLKPDAYGTDPRVAYSQLTVQDITQNHLRDAEVVMEMMQRVLGTTENIMGMVNQGGRKTATEVRTSSTFGVNRLKTNTEHFSSMGWAPFSRNLVKNTQQHYDTPRKFRIAGDMLGLEAMLVSPEDIAGDFDYIPVDGTLPVDRFAMANLWKEMMQVMMGIEPLATRTDWLKLMQYVAQLTGMKNFSQFKIQVQPDQALAAGQQAGNVVPLPKVGGENRDFNQMPGSANVAGVGRTG
jgi:hypothetical protein